MFDEPVKKIKSKLSSLKILNSFISFDEQYIMDSSKLSLIILFIKVHEFSETSDRFKIILLPAEIAAIIGSKLSKKG
ncbi:hypothetical protein NWE57_01825 [Mycoplasmopsis cynos]|nr:hypothetical protein [Mycoplasmopsis cynos]UWV92796.1 hypothetical protein NWE57_01825 [Mycoplasmopsis cynos]